MGPPMICLRFMYHATHDYPIATQWVDVVVVVVAVCCLLCGVCSCLLFSKDGCLSGLFCLFVLFFIVCVVVCCLNTACVVVCVVC